MNRTSSEILRNKLNQYYFNNNNGTYGIISKEITFNKKIEWEHKISIFRLYEYIDLFGNIPDIIDFKKGGLAIWNKSANSKVSERHNYFRVEIRDFIYQHTKPIRHPDFLFVTIKYKMDPKKIKHLEDISKSILYYDLGEELTAACHFIEASIATLSIVKQYNENEISLKQARQEYDIRISELLKEYNNYEKYKKENDNLSIISIKNKDTPLRDIYESYIFDFGSDELNRNDILYSKGRFKVTKEGNYNTIGLKIEKKKDIKISI